MSKSLADFHVSLKVVLVHTENHLFAFLVTMGAAGFENYSVM